MAKSLFIYSKPESSRAIFKSKKKREKTCEKHVPGVWMGIKIAEKLCIFHVKSSSCSPWKIITFELSRYTDGAKKVTKNRSFLTSKSMFFYVQNRYFHRSRYMDAVKKRAQSFHFSLKIHHFLHKNHCFFKEKSMFSHISVYRWSWKNLQKSIAFLFKFDIFQFKIIVFVVPGV